MGIGDWDRGMRWAEGRCRSWCRGAIPRKSRQPCRRRSRRQAGRPVRHRTSSGTCRLREPWRNRIRRSNAWTAARHRNPKRFGRSVERGHCNRMKSLRRRNGCRKPGSPPSCRCPPVRHRSQCHRCSAGGIAECRPSLRSEGHP